MMRIGAGVVPAPVWTTPRVGSRPPRTSSQAVTRARSTTSAQLLNPNEVEHYSKVVSAVELEEIRLLRVSLEWTKAE